MKTLFRRWLILNKRLFKKASFVVILLLIPLLVAAMGIASAGEDIGLFTVALAAKDREDKLTQEVISSLTDGTQIFRFIVCDSPDTASDLVENGKADAAWIFAEDLESRIDDFVNHMHRRNAFVVIIQREDNPLLRLTHEKLNAALYPHLSQSLYRNYMYNNILTLNDLTPQQLEEYYNAVGSEGDDIFDFVYSNGSDKSDSENTSFLLSPLRGLMAITMTLGGFAIAMFYTQDELRGTFDRLPIGKRFALSVAYHSTAVINMAVAVLIALFLTGMATSVWRELASMTMYCIITVGFCMALRLICRDNRLLGAVIPLITVVMIVLCPIFFNISAVPIVPYLLPPYYYLNSIYNLKFFGYMALYAIAVYTFDYVIYRIRSR